MVKKILASIALIIPVFLVFHHLFLGSLATWGDAPYFYTSMIQSLVGEPLAWVERGVSFGGVNNFLFLSPLMFLYGLIGKSDLAVRVVFYFPSIVLAGVGMYFFTRYLKLSSVVQFFSTLIYLLNTYILLVIDGGQVGVALSYGLFPLVLMFLKRFIDSANLKNFCLALTLLFILSVADPRVALICLLTGVVFALLEGKIKNLIYLAPLIVGWVGVSMYWIYPLLTNGLFSSFTAAELMKLKWYQPFLLYSPNWPDNLFGVALRPPFYFFGVPVLIFLGVFLKKDWKLLVLYLSFAFLSLGILPLEKLPFGFAFRDTTKFFIPMILFAGILIGKAAYSFKHLWIQIPLYFYILLLVYQGIFGHLNFVLSGRGSGSDFDTIARNLENDTNFFRTVWFPLIYPKSFESETHPAVEARDLAGFWPFAVDNTGNDAFNFLNSKKFVDWFKFFGIKYLILSGNPRELAKSASETQNWNGILNLVISNKSLTPVKWETKVPVYEVDGAYPKSFAVKMLYGIIGPPVKSEKIMTNAVYFEDGKFDPAILNGKGANSIKLVFNQSDENDLAMSFLQKYFLGGSDAKIKNWAVFQHSDYLKYKYELLIRGIDFIDFDYGHGISFSTVKNEKLIFDFKVPVAGDYVYIERSMSPAGRQNVLRWKVETVNLPKGDYRREVINELGIKVFNVAGIVPKKEYDAAGKQAEIFMKHFGVVDPSSVNYDLSYQKVDLKPTGTLKYGFNIPDGYSWLILTENYNPLWKLSRPGVYSASVPVNSMVNGFYAESDLKNMEIEFLGQKNLRIGIYWSVVSVLVLAGICLMKSKN